MSEEVLKKYPPMSIYCGTNDPLFDDSIRFLEKMNNLGKKCNLRAYKGFNHGILAKSLGNWEPAKIFLEDICTDFQRHFDTN